MRKYLFYPSPKKVDLYQRGDMNCLCHIIDDKAIHVYMDKVQRIRAHLVSKFLYFIYKELKKKLFIALIDNNYNTLEAQYSHQI